MKLHWFGGLLLAVFLVATAGAAVAERVRVEVIPSEQPICYLQFEEDALRVAATPEGLAEAKALKPADKPARWDVGAGVKATGYQFPQFAMPVALPGVEEAKASFNITRFSSGTSAAAQWEASGMFRLGVRDAAGTEWTYVIYGATPSYDPNTSAASHEVLTMPIYYDLSTMAPRVVTRVKGRQVGLELQLMVMDDKERDRLGTDMISAVNDLQRDGKPAAARLEVRDAKGKVISAKNGTVETFAGGWSGPNYSVRVAKKGTYTAKATVQTPSGARTAEAKFVVK